MHRTFCIAHSKKEQYLQHVDQPCLQMQRPGVSESTSRVTIVDESDNMSIGQTMECPKSSAEYHFAVRSAELSCLRVQGCRSEIGSLHRMQDVASCTGCSDQSVYTRGASTKPLPKDAGKQQSLFLSICVALMCTIN